MVHEIDDKQAVGTERSYTSCGGFLFLVSLVFFFSLRLFHECLVLTPMLYIVGGQTQ